MSEETYTREVKRGLGAIEKKLRKKKFKCLYPGCNSTAISSHSQQKERQLRSISQDGYVYSLVKDSYKASKNPGDILTIEKHGISEASTFPGYCSKHDRELFLKIDTQPLKINNEKQAFLLFLRTFSYEFSQKRAAFEWYSLFSDLMRSLDRYDLIEIELLQIGVKQFLEIDGTFYFTLLWEAFDKNNFNFIESEWATINKNIGISSSSTFSPLLNLHYQHMATLNDGEPQPLLSFNVIPDANCTYVIASWLKKHNDLSNWLREKLKAENLEKLINVGAFAASIDTCISPNLWRSLSDDVKLDIKNLMLSDYSWEKLEKIPNIIRL